MDIKTYSLKFKQFNERADRQELLCTALKEYQEKLSQLCSEAAAFYSSNATYGELEYNEKITIFLSFDSHLKELKKSFPAKLEARNASLRLFSAFDSTENEPLLERDFNYS